MSTTRSPCRFIWSSRRKTPKFSCIVEASSSRMVQGRSPRSRSRTVWSSRSASVSTEAGTSTVVCERAQSAAWAPARPAGGEDHRLRADRLQPAVEEVPADDALAAVVVHDELPREELLVDLQVALHDLLVEDLDQHVAGDVGRVRRPRRARGAERALRDPAVLGAGEDGAPVLELVDVARRLLAQDLDRVLVAEVVGALDGVEGVDLRVVLGGVPERRVDPALRRTGVATRGMDLRDEGDVGAR